VQSASSRYQPWRAPIERLRGMSDIDSESFIARRSIISTFQDLFQRHGYQPIDTPVLEQTELFLRKSGGERVAQMYAVNYRDREISLRPEFTAPVLRHYVEFKQASPLPVRLTYAGPVFRYERPQAGRSRQFTEVGCELLGASGPVADAEIIHLALEGLATVGIRGKLVVGHIGVVLDFLGRLPLRQRARDWLIWSMERLRKGQTVDVDDEVAGLVSGDRLSTIFSQMSETLKDVPAEQLESWVLAVLHEVGLQMQGGTRSPDEIVAGVVAKMNQSSDADDVRRAFQFIHELVQVQGPPDTVLPELRALVARHGLTEEPIADIQRTLALLGAYGYASGEIELNLGLGRGLHYYTGILFEIYDPSHPWLQLCGGGRYDELAQSLGAREPTPACGFSYGLERIAEVSGEAGVVPVPDVLVAPVGAEAEPAAARVAERLRAAGQRVEMDVRSRSLTANRRYAARRGIAEIVFVDAQGHEDRQRLGEYRAAAGVTPERDEDRQR
jgi:histidyl-tRNA synthetase